MDNTAILIGTVGRTCEAAKGIAMRGAAAMDAVRRWTHCREPKIHRVLAGEVVPRSKSLLCVYSHFDRNDVIDDYVVHYIRQLFEAGCEVIFVSAAEGLPDAECDKVRGYTREIVVRENLGHDFGSWKTAICREFAASTAATCGYDGLIIANDSVYGPFRPLAPIISRMSAQKCDFWGITDSWRYGRHVQSYFMAFSQRVVQSDAFRRFWMEQPYSRSKHAVIWNGEIGLSRTLAAAGFEFDVLCRYEDLRARNTRAFSEVERRSALGRPVNSTHYFWHILLTEGKCPFLKVQLLRDNPKKVPNVAHWRETLSDGPEFSRDLIEHHLVRMKTRLS